jgi:hypothetical protein
VGATKNAFLILWELKSVLVQYPPAAKKHNCTHIIAMADSEDLKNLLSQGVITEEEYERLVDNRQLEAEQRRAMIAGRGKGLFKNHSWSPGHTKATDDAEYECPKQSAVCMPYAIRIIPSDLIYALPSYWLPYQIPTSGSLFHRQLKK